MCGAHGEFIQKTTATLKIDPLWLPAVPFATAFEDVAFAVVGSAIPQVSARPHDVVRHEKLPAARTFALNRAGAGLLRNRQL
jgi:hypothetical protein